LSQYADDTTLTLDGSEKSMKVLKCYGEIFGLQVNVDKTKVVWIGSMKNSVPDIKKLYDLTKSYVDKKNDNKI